MRLRIIGFFICFMTVTAIMAACVSREPEGYEPRELYEGPGISRARAAKMLAFIHSDLADIRAMTPVINFADVAPGSWYYPFVNAVFTAGIMRGDDYVFMPEAPLTMGQAWFLLNAMDPDNGPPDSLRQNPDDPMPYSLWTELFLNVIKSMEDSAGISPMTIIPLEAGQGKLIANKGPFGAAGIDFRPYIDKEITVLQKDREILALLSVDNLSPMLRNVYLMDANGYDIRIFSGGAFRTFPFERSILPGRLGDVRIYQGAALYVNVHTETVTGPVVRISADFTEFRDMAPLPNAPDMKVYDLSSGRPVMREIKDIITGSDTSEFILRDGYIQAAFINNTPSPVNMRVLLSATGFQGHFHDSVSLTSDVAYTVWAGGAPFVYGPGEIFTLSPAENLHLFDPGIPRVYVTMNEPDGRIELLSVERRGVNPRYRGHIEIALEPDGRFTIVNELPFEEYLYAVISSENPMSSEAAKARAIVARSHGFVQFFDNSFHMLGANVDDSTLSQVYNNFPENQESMEAVRATSGFALTYRGNLISPNFFLNSAGITANSGEVWADFQTGEFPGPSQGFLRSVRLYSGPGFGDLSLEENASAFFRNWDVQAYDSEFPWFRWNVTMAAQELTDSVNRALPYPIGDVLAMEVLARGQGGNVMSMRIIGAEAAVIIHTEPEIRRVLSPSPNPGGDIILINRHMGLPVANMPLLPSAFFVMDIHYNENGILSAITFHGGGHGHGTGMSKNGAEGMARAGFAFDEILRYYYTGVVISRIR